MWAQSVPEQRVHLKDIEEKHYNTVIEDTTNALKHLPYAYALWISHRAMQKHAKFTLSIALLCQEIPASKPFPGRSDYIHVNNTCRMQLFCDFPTKTSSPFPTSS